MISTTPMQTTFGPGFDLRVGYLKGSDDVIIFLQNHHRSKRRREAVSVWQPQELPIYSFNVAH